jgi:hypothetical protein
VEVERKRDFKPLTNNQRRNKMAEKKEKLLTPIGEAKWAHVHTPQAAFKDERGNPKGDPKYMIDIVFSVDSPEWKAWATDLRTRIDALPVQTDKRTGEVLKKQMPIKRELDSNDQPTGRFYVTFKTGDKFNPGVFDRFGNEIEKTVLIGNGSKVRVSYTPSVYDAFGGGIALYFNAVQVLDLVEYGKQDAKSHGFDVEVAPVKTEKVDPTKLDPSHPDYLPF